MPKAHVKLIIFHLKVNGVKYTASKDISMFQLTPTGRISCFILTYMALAIIRCQDCTQTTCISPYDICKANTGVTNSSTIAYQSLNSLFVVDACIVQSHFHIYQILRNFQMPMSVEWNLSIHVSNYIMFQPFSAFHLFLYFSFRHSYFIIARW